MQLRLFPLLFTFIVFNLTAFGQAGCDCWIPPDATYTEIDNTADWTASFGINSPDDGSYGPIALPFTFDLYGQTFNQVWVNTNGNVTFGTFFTTFTSTGFPSPGPIMVAPFWADVDLTGGFVGSNIVSFKVTPTAFYVNWENVGYYSQHTDKVNTFQLIITDGNDPVLGVGSNVSFCYQDMQWTTGDVTGAGGFGGSAASVGANHGNGADYIQFGRFDQPGAAYDGPFNLNDGIDWLDNKNFVFTTAVSTTNIPPIASSIFLCDTLTVCVGELTQIPIDFIAPEPAQTVIASSSSAGLSNYSELSNTSPNINASILGQFTALPAEVGFQSIIYTATDNGVPPLTTTVEIVVEVLPAAAITNGVLDICETDTATNLFFYLGGSPIAGGTWTDSLGTPFTGIFDPAVDASGDYLYSYSAGGNCPSSGIVTVSVFPAPNAGTDTVMVYCTSDPVSDLFTVLGGSPVLGGTWAYPNGSAFSGLLDPSSDPSGIYAYTVQGTAPCLTASANVDLTIFTVPSAGSNATLDLCANEPLVDLFTVLGGAPDIGGAWTLPSGGVSGGTFLAASDPTGIYTYIVQGAATCPPDSATITVSVDPLPNAGSDNVLALCRNAAVSNMFTLVAPADAGGSWIDPSSAVHSGTLDPSTDSSGVYYYIVNGTGQCSGLVDSSQVSVTLSEVPIVSFTVDSTASCVPFPVNFTNTTDPVFLDGTCTWSFGDGGTAQSCGITSYTYQNQGIYDVTLTVTTAAGCTASLTQTAMITADHAPTAEFFMDPNPTSVDATTILMSALSPVPDQWNWDIVGYTNFTGSPDIEYTFPQSEGGEYEVCLAVEDIYGCAAQECQTLVVIDPLLVFVPNAFTPSGDAINDYFFPYVSGADPEAYELYIFDRWGTVVFESTEQSTPWLGAKDNSGELLPTGVYVWRLITRAIGETELREYIGHVTLIR